ncbi:MAG: tetratricopeptide repeat protein [Flavobacterium sp.]|nr:tetratricopeptide repeat protein [Flavobacterium sp.]
MKKLLYIVLFVSQVFWAQTAFEKGNDFYKKEKYQEAAASYEQVVQSGKQSSELYFNLGNAYYKMHKVAPAIYNYEKALLLNPKDHAAQTNLHFAQKMTIDEIKIVPKVGFSKILNDLLDVFHYEEWAWIAVGSAVFFLLCFIGYYFASQTIVKRIFFFGMFVVLVSMLISVSAAIAEKDNYNSERPAIVFAEVVPVKSEPKTTASDAFVLHEGAKVFVIESLDNWRKIQLTDDKEGWIEKEAIKELK